MRTEERESSGTSRAGTAYARAGNGARADAARRPTNGTSNIHEDPTLGHAVAHAMAAAKSIVADRLALTATEVRIAIARLAAGGVLLTAGAVLFVHAWFVLAVGAVLAMGMWWGDVLSLPIRLLIATVATGALGAGFVASGVAALRGPAPSRTIDT